MSSCPKCGRVANPDLGVCDKCNAAEARAFDWRDLADLAASAYADMASVADYKVCRGDAHLWGEVRRALGMIRHIQAHIAAAAVGDDDVL